MADGTIGQWGTISFEIPDFLEDLREGINDVAEFLVAVLDIVLAAMDLAKTFLVGFLDPIMALVQAIIDEIEGLLNDLRKLGLYITGDWTLIQNPGYPYNELRGGFSEYERRMIARLTDRTDPTRPDVSARTKVLSLFLYQSVDISDIQRLIAFILDMVSFFKMTFRPTSGLPVPSITDIRYGNDTASVFYPQTLGEYFTTDDTPPNQVEVRWKMTPPARKNPYVPFTNLYMPGGFLVTVSTVPDGMPVVYDRPVANTDGETSVADTSKKVQPHQFDVIRRAGDGKPLILFGGAKMIQTAGWSEFNTSIDSDGNIKQGKTRIYAVRNPADNAVVPLEELTQGGDPIFQETYFVPIEVSGSQWMTGEYSIVLSLDEMPFDADIKVEDNKMVVTKGDRASNLYVRVATCTSAIGSGDKEYKFDFTALSGQQDATSIPMTVPMSDETVGVADVSEFSAPREITFPNANTAAYIESLKAAMLILALSRPDLLTVEEQLQTLSDKQLSLIVDGKKLMNGVALQPCGLEGLRHLLGFLYDDYAKERAQKDGEPGGFRSDLRDRITRTVNDFYGATGPMPEVEKVVVEQTAMLRELTWGEIFKQVHPDFASLLPTPIDEMTLWESLDTDKYDQGGDSDYGLAINPYCTGLTEGVVADFFLLSDLIIKDRKPHFMEVVQSPPDETFVVQATATPEEAKKLLTVGAPGLRVYYEKFIQKDGSLLIPPDAYSAMEQYRVSDLTQGSADDSPVFVIDAESLPAYSYYNPKGIGGQKGAMFFCRNLLYQYEDGILFRQAALALNVAAAALTRSPEDGAWLNIRFFDTMPGMDDFLSAILNWMETIKASLASIVDTILKYIEFIEARIIELQQLIRRINSLIQTILGFSFRIPQSSALMLLSNGTAGTLGDFISADNKPSDSPLAYGAGIAIVIPAGPALAMDILKAFLSIQSGKPQSGATMSSGTSQDAINAEQLPPPPPLPPDPPPDVL